jgi:hypothetical protein
VRLDRGPLVCKTFANDLAGGSRAVAYENCRSASILANAIVTGELESSPLVSRGERSAGAGRGVTRYAQRLCTDNVQNYCAPVNELRHVDLDSAQVRCLAHPLRSRLLAALRLEGPSTSAGLAQRLRTNSGATSYHLRQLAEVGLIVEEPDRGSSRERYWKSAHDVTNWTETRFDDDPDDRAAAEWLTGHHLRLTNRWREDWLESRTEWPTAWREAASLGDMRVRLTPAQTAAMVSELEAIVERYLTGGPERAEEHASEGDAADVLVLIDVFPTHSPAL